MADERRYQDNEVEEILRRAVNEQELSHPTLTRSQGLTLREIQEIGREAGIDPSRIGDAAHAVVARRQAAPRGTFLGMPVSVNRVVDLSRAMTEREWEIVVGDLRDTFSAPGQVGEQGTTREWTNGNLRVLLEPTGSGQRLRFSTFNRRLRFLGSVGVVEIIIGLVFLAILIPNLLASGGLTWAVAAKLLPSIIAAGAGVAFLGWAGIELPRWAGQREAQMEHIAARVQALIETPPGQEPGP